eukprot:TRINITY_DN19705_c0_g1_i3.p1 TRINITY_DN19705_c0_g1~~TRINITY_DN19705_c0_g1_i3.p1  ORF type:complete len:132 (-),score=36.92 TRINITY_DN19705_c0_g1_i3:359-754(-)
MSLFLLSLDYYHRCSDRRCVQILGVKCSVLLFFFFFFKQKTAYEMLRSLVGSEMCIRDRYQRRVRAKPVVPVPKPLFVTTNASTESSSALSSPAVGAEVVALRAENVRLRAEVSTLRDKLREAKRVIESVL